MQGEEKPMLPDWWGAGDQASHAATGGRGAREPRPSVGTEEDSVGHCGSGDTEVVAVEEQGASGTFFSIFSKFCCSFHSLQLKSLSLVIF